MQMFASRQAWWLAYLNVLHATQSQVYVLLRQMRCVYLENPVFVSEYVQSTDKGAADIGANIANVTFLNYFYNCLAIV